MQIWGMGIASHDLTGDGMPEVFLTSQGDNKLQTTRRGGEPVPSTATSPSPAGLRRTDPFAGDNALPSTAWHAEFQDVNNDTYVDLFVAKGNVEAQPDFAAEDPSNLLLGRPDGTFVEGAEDAGILNFGRARGAALADFNLDGLLDLVVVNRRENVRLWRNVGSGDSAAASPMGNWVAVRLEQPGAQPRRHRSLGRGPGRGPYRRARGDDRWRPCRRAARLDPLRPGRCRARPRSGCSGPTATSGRG